MSKHEINTSSNERSFFFQALKSQPLFLILHIPFLIASITSKVRNYFKIKLSTPHQGSKSWPAFLPSRRLSCRAEVGNGVRKLNLPSIVIKENEALIGGYQYDQPVFADEGDPELYLMENRWGNLLEVSLGKSHTPIDCNRLVTKWISEHTNKEADPAWEVYSSCERVVNLLIYLSTRPIDEVDVSREVAEFVEYSLEWIYQHLEYYGSVRTNNHILNNARALIVGGVAIENGFYINVGMSVFRKCLPEMILEHGMLRERSSHYQLIVLNWVLDTQLFMEFHVNKSIDDALFLQEYAEKMLKASALLCDDRGRLLAMVGDVSPDITPLNTSARLAGLYSCYWPYHLANLPVQFQDGWFVLTCDEGSVIGNFPVGNYPPAHPTHGHGDFTGFSWTNGAQAILTDPGRYRYTADEVSLSQKNAAGHNVPLVNGFSALAESLLFSGEWRPKPYASAKLNLETGVRDVSLTHDGFSRSTLVTSHTRTIALNGRNLEVTDTFDGKGEVNIDFLWHFGIEFKAYGKGSCTLVSDKESVHISFINALTGALIQAHSVDASGLNVSLKYGAKENSTGLKVRFVSMLPVSIKTSFKLDKICAV